MYRGTLPKQNEANEQGAIHIVALILIILSVIQFVVLRNVYDNSNDVRAELQTVKEELLASEKRIDTLEVLVAQSATK